MNQRRFTFRGTVPASKSMLNRLLILQSYDQNNGGDLKIIGDSLADDVVKMRTGLRSLTTGAPCDCGDAGTTLRFLALRASRMPGHHVLTGTARLFSRPQGELLHILEQLGVEVSLETNTLHITGTEWTFSPLTGVRIDRSESSQFSSALVLNAWGLKEDLQIQFSGARVSESYFGMTVKLVERLGMNLIWLNENTLRIPARQELSPKMLRAEIDLSSAFAVVALAVAGHGVAEIENWPRESLQPDAVFTSVLTEMGCSVRWMDGGKTLHVSRTTANLRPVEIDLANAPDLFPVLSVLCALAPGVSRLFGAPHLKNKESDRIAKSMELVRIIGASATAIDGGLKIEGVGAKVGSQACTFEPDHDHRLAMAAAVANAGGANITILDPAVVNKSFPEFWNVVRGEA